MRDLTALSRWSSASTTALAAARLRLRTKAPGSGEAAVKDAPIRTFENLIDDVGGMGKFQIMLVLMIDSCELLVSWSLYLMAFGGYVPEYTCTVDGLPSGGAHINQCQVNGTSCSSFDFAGPESTVVSEWGLVCDLAWGKRLIISMQMFGIMIGAVMAGQLSDYLGRHKTLYLCYTFLMLSTLVCAFSQSWIMFAIMRVFVGIGTGSIFVSMYPYPMEFLSMRWRALLCIRPFWFVGVGSFSLAAYILKDWQYLHFAGLVLSSPVLIGWFYVPESIRWLALKGRSDDGVKVLELVAKRNGRKAPADAKEVLMAMEEIERESKEKHGSYTYLDLFKGTYMLKITLIIFANWFVILMSYFGIVYGVSSLGGNLYLFMFLLCVVELPSEIMAFLINSKLGRKPTVMASVSLAAIGTLGCMLAYEFASENVRNKVIGVLSLMSYGFLSAAWSTMMVWTSEIYPTVVRQLGFAMATVGGRIGSIIAPFVVNLDSMPKEAYVIMSVALGCCILATFFLPESKGKQMEDSLAEDDSHCNKVAPARADIPTLPRPEF